MTVELITKLFGIKNETLEFQVISLALYSGNRATTESAQWIICQYLLI